MALLTTSPSARLAVIYVTSGALIEAWSVIWYRWMNTHPTEWEGLRYICFGLMITGVILFVIGLSLGWIGRSARRAEMPPAEITPGAIAAEKNIAAHMPVAAVNPVAPAVMAPVPTTIAAPPTMPVAAVGTPVADSLNPPVVIRR